LPTYPPFGFLLLNPSHAVANISPGTCVQFTGLQRCHNFGVAATHSRRAQQFGNLLVGLTELFRVRRSVLGFPRGKKFKRGNSNAMTRLLTCNGNSKQQMHGQN